MSRKVRKIVFDFKSRPYNDTWNWSANLLCKTSDELTFVCMPNSHSLFSSHLLGSLHNTGVSPCYCLAPNTSVTRFQITNSLCQHTVVSLTLNSGCPCGTDSESPAGGCGSQGNWQDKQNTSAVVMATDRQQLLRRLFIIATQHICCCHDNRQVKNVT